MENTHGPTNKLNIDDISTLTNNYDVNPVDNLPDNVKDPSLDIPIPPPIQSQSQQSLGIKAQDTNNPNILLGKMGKGKDTTRTTRKKWPEPLLNKNKVQLDNFDDALIPIPVELFDFVNWETISLCKISETGSFGVLFIICDYPESQNISSQNKNKEPIKGVVVIKSQNLDDPNLYADAIAESFDIPIPKFKIINTLSVTGQTVALHCLKQATLQIYDKSVVKQCLAHSNAIQQFSHYSPAVYRFFGRQFIKFMEWIPSVSIDTYPNVVVSKEHRFLSQSFAFNSKCVNSVFARNFKILGSLLFLDLLMNNGDRFPLAPLWNHCGNYGNILVNIQNLTVCGVDNNFVPLIDDSVPMISDSHEIQSIPGVKNRNKQKTFISNVTKMIISTVRHFLKYANSTQFIVSPLLVTFSSIISGLTFLNLTITEQSLMEIGFIRACSIALGWDDIFFQTLISNQKKHFSTHKSVETFSNSVSIFSSVRYILAQVETEISQKDLTRIIQEFQSRTENLLVVPGKVPS